MTPRIKIINHIEPRHRTADVASPRIVYNKLLGGWFVVVGPHQTPINGRFNSKEEAKAWLKRERGVGGEY